MSRVWAATRAVRSLARLLDGRRVALLGLAIASAISAIVLIGMDAHLTFISDDWSLLVVRRGWGGDTFLDPFHENIVLGPVLVFKVQLALFGMRSALPFYAVSIGFFLTSAVLLFVYLRLRLGDWLALLGALLILFLGAAFEDLLWAFQMGFFGSMAAGLGILLALDRDDDRGDRIACGLLLLSLAFSSLGLVFAAAAVVELMLSPWYRSRRAYVSLGPLSVYIAWWLGWGRTADSHLSIHNVLHLPVYVVEAMGAGAASLCGLATGAAAGLSSPLLTWCGLALLTGIAIAAYRTVRSGREYRQVVLTLVMAFTFWVLAALNQSLERFPTSSRYQYISAVLLLLIAAELLREIRVPRLAVGAVTIFTAIALTSGSSLLFHKYTDHWRHTADSIRSSLAAVDIAGPSANRDSRLRFPPTVSVPIGAYLSSSRAHGSPAFSEVELAERPLAERKHADVTLIEALGITLRPAGLSDRPPRCRMLSVSSDGSPTIELRPGRFVLSDRTPGTADEILLGRFAGGASVKLGSIGAPASTSFLIPVDNSSRPWHLQLRGAGRVQLCSTVTPRFERPHRPEERGFPLALERAQPVSRG